MSVDSPQQRDEITNRVTVRLAADLNESIVELAEAGVYRSEPAVVVDGARRIIEDPAPVDECVESLRRVRGDDRGPTKCRTFRLTDWIAVNLDAVVEQGHYQNRSEAIRHGIKRVDETYGDLL